MQLGLIPLAAMTMIFCGATNDGQTATKRDENEYDHPAKLGIGMGIELAV
jgi:hypothetical protein